MFWMEEENGLQDLPGRAATGRRAGGDWELRSVLGPPAAMRRTRIGGDGAGGRERAGGRAFFYREVEVDGRRLCVWFGRRDIPFPVCLVGVG